MDDNMPDTPHVEVELTTRELQTLAICLEVTAGLPAFDTYPAATKATAYRVGAKIRNALAQQPDRLDSLPDPCTILHEMHINWDLIFYRGKPLGRLKRYSPRYWGLCLVGSEEDLGYYKTEDDAIARLASMILNGEIYL